MLTYVILLAILPGAASSSKAKPPGVSCEGILKHVKSITFKSCATFCNKEVLYHENNAFRKTLMSGQQNNGF